MRMNHIERTNRSPLLSIVIPTRNRWSYARPTIQSCLSLAEGEVEVVVLDTSDDSAPGAEFCASVHAPGLVYRYWAPPVDIISSFNGALSLARGTYVCLLGDDDAVLPKIIDVAREANELQIDIVSSTIRSVCFQWPDFRSRYFGSRQAGKVYLRPYSGAAGYGELSEALKLCARYAGQMNQLQWLPRVYMGLVRRSILERSHPQLPGFFGGVCPDVYGVIAAATLASRWCIVDYPLIVAGSSARSTSGMGALRQHRGQLEGVEHFRAFTHLDWPALIPLYWTLESVWAAGAWAALRDYQPSLLNQFDLNYMYALMLLNNLGNSRILVEQIGQAIEQARAAGYSAGWGRVAARMIPALLARFSYYAERLQHPGPSAGADRVFTAQNSHEAVNELSRCMAGDGWSLTAALNRGGNGHAAQIPLRHGTTR